MTTEADQLARDCAEAMWKNDHASQGLGMKIEEIGAGRAVLSRTVRPDMVNGHAIAHGGLIFTLADSTFAFACNSYDQRAVAQHCAVTFVNPAKLGDRLTATGQERGRQGRGGIYDITVTDQDGRVIAEFRGHSRTIKGTVRG